MIQPTQQEVLQFLKESNAIEGVYGEDMLQQSLTAWDYLISLDNISAGNLKKVHKIIMLLSNLAPDEKGYYRKCPVYIGDKEMMKYQAIPECITNWIKCMNRKVSRSQIDKEFDAKMAHVTFEKIHCFIDGNGRTGRIFMNWHRIKILGLPLLIIKASERGEYYKWFR